MLYSLRVLNVMHHHARAERKNESRFYRVCVSAVDIMHNERFSRIEGICGWLGWHARRLAGTPRGRAAAAAEGAGRRGQRARGGGRAR